MEALVCQIKNEALSLKRHGRILRREVMRLYVLCISTVVIPQLEWL